MFTALSLICTKLLLSSKVNEPPETVTPFVIIRLFSELMTTVPEFTWQEHPAKSEVEEKSPLNTISSVPVGADPLDHAVPSQVFVSMDLIAALADAKEVHEPELAVTVYVPAGAVTFAPILVAPAGDIV
ncbi:hypothetical protein Q767_06335 [Flavobacterium enshiense DK69]|uniref:Uncharacterized protein n=1 Tax=Flavobacterium enshiense DK69 TaxID=1107311 RepID=A0A0A2MYI7_9FLAO|nr:hypothetical protein Q767_06335 [Flavobacterium enshiense DK69]